MAYVRVAARFQNVARQLRVDRANQACLPRSSFENLSQFRWQKVDMGRLLIQGYVMFQLCETIRPQIKRSILISNYIDRLDIITIFIFTNFSLLSIVPVG